MGNSSQPEKKPNLTFLYSALDNVNGYPFQDLFGGFIPVYGPEDMFSPNGVLIVWGGADISPAFYGQHGSIHTMAGNEMGSKDILEMNLMAHAMKNGIPILGICRGAQMACALAGGTLIQHVEGHGKTHLIEDNDGNKMHTTSVHHQMMFPWETDHELIAWASPLQSTHYCGPWNDQTEQDDPIVFPDNLKPEHREPEIVYFPSIKALGIQGHPEFVHNEKHEFVQYSRKLVKQYLIKPFLTE